MDTIDRVVDCRNSLFGRPKQVVKPPLHDLPVILKDSIINADPIPSNNSRTIISYSSFGNPKQTVRPNSLNEPMRPSSPKRDRPKKGYALILNHEQYDVNYKNKPPKIRLGTQIDVTALQEVFQEYNVKTEVEDDLSLEGINNKVESLKSEDFSEYKCFIIVILTHGDKKNILCAYDQIYNFIEVIEDPLLIANATLIGKPKIFVIQACRGSLRETDSISIPTIFDQIVDSKRDIFKCYSTYEGLVSFRSPTEGSIFIQTFCEKLKEFGQTEAIYEIMLRVNRTIFHEEDFPQVSTIESSMGSNFCFGDLLK